MEFYQAIVQRVSIICSAQESCPPCFTFDDIYSMSPHIRWHFVRHYRHSIYVAQAKVCDACHFWQTCKHSHCERDISRVQLNSRMYLCPPPSRDLPLLWHVHDGRERIRTHRLRRGCDYYPVLINTIRATWCPPEQRWSPLGYRHLQLVRPLLLKIRGGYYRQHFDTLSERHHVYEKNVLTLHTHMLNATHQKIVVRPDHAHLRHAKCTAGESKVRTQNHHHDHRKDAENLPQEPKATRMSSPAAHRHW